MATALENLLARREAVCAEIAALDSTKAGGKANASGLPVSVDHQGYKRGLYDELAMIEQRIAALQGPWAIETQVEP